MKILDVGCGKRKHRIKNAEVIGLDKFPLEGVDIVHNLEDIPLPFDDNEFDGIIAYHILEHIQNFIPLMEELHRILKRNGWLRIWFPYAGSVRTFAHPDHKRFFAYDTFLIFTSEYDQNFYSKVRFKINNREFIWNLGCFKLLGRVVSALMNLNPKFYEKFLAGILSADEMYVELEAMK